MNLLGGGEFSVDALVQYIENLEEGYIIQGQQNVRYSEHTKPTSLDYWLRQFATNPDTKQATNNLLDALVATGLFELVDTLICPETGRECKGLILR